MRHLLSASLLLILAWTPTQLFGQVSDSLVQSLMEAYDVPGLALSIVHADSIYVNSWGYADANQAIPITPDTPFRIASVAKVFVAGTVLIEADKGNVGLHDEIPDFSDAALQHSESVTLHHLLTHTAGFDERLIGYGARSSDLMQPLGAYLTERMPARGWPVGTQISYSNHGMSLAAYVVEQARGIVFAEVAQQDLFQPLGMQSTRFLTGGDPVPSNSAAPLRCEDGDCEQLPHYFSHAYPAGLAFSTARDMSTFINVILNAEKEEPPLAELIPERFLHDDRIPGMSYGFFNQSHQGVHFLSHAGSVPGYWSLLLVSPEANFGFFFSANGGSSGFGERLRDVLINSFLGDGLKSLPAPDITEDPSIRAGVYESTRYSHNTIERFPQVFHNSINVTVDTDTLIIFSGGRLNKYVQVGEALYENVDGSDIIAFDVREGKMRLYRSSFVYGAGLPVAYEKRPWYRAPGFLNEYVSWLLGLPIIILFFVWPISAGAAVYLRRRKGVTNSKVSLTHSSAWWLAASLASLFVVFGLGFVARSNRMLQSGELVFGMPDTLMALTWIPAVHAGLAVLMCLMVILVWKGGWWDKVRRVLFSFVTGLIVLQVIFLVEWNYLPMSW